MVCFCCFCLTELELCSISSLYALKLQLPRCRLVQDLLQGHLLQRPLLWPRPLGLRPMEYRSEVRCQCPIVMVSITPNNIDESLKLYPFVSHCTCAQLEDPYRHAKIWAQKPPSLQRGERTLKLPSRMRLTWTSRSHLEKLALRSLANSFGRGRGRQPC